MKPRSKLALASACALMCAAAPGDARPVAASHEWVGTWRLDLHHSRFSGVAPRGEIRTIAVANNRMSVRSTVTPASGRDMHFNYNVTLDGRFHPLVGNPDGDSIALRLVNPRKVTIQVQRNGKPAAVAATEVSSHRMVMDRRRLQLSGSPSEDLLVYDRVR